jgi:hypothetical protein
VEEILQLCSFVMHPNFKMKKKCLELILQLNFFYLKDIQRCSDF